MLYDVTEEDFEEWRDQFSFSITTFRELKECYWPIYEVKLIEWSDLSISSNQMQLLRSQTVIQMTEARFPDNSKTARGIFLVHREHLDRNKKTKVELINTYNAISS